MNARASLALLVLRVGMGVSLFARHGVEKIAHFADMLSRFPDPLHLGSGPSLVIALISDVLASLLVVAGAGVRYAAGLALCNIGVAWVFVHHLEFVGASEHGEVCALYVTGFSTLAIAGGGRFGADYVLEQRRAGRLVQETRAPGVK